MKAWTTKHRWLIKKLMFSLKSKEMNSKENHSDVGKFVKFIQEPPPDRHSLQNWITKPYGEE